MVALADGDTARSGNPRQARPLAILGAYGGFNIGDEMILRSIAMQAREVGYTGTINVISSYFPPSNADLLYREAGLRLVHWRNPCRSALAVFGRDLFIGGGQIIDGASGLNNPGLQTPMAMVARLSGGRVLIGGVSTGSLGRKDVRLAYKALFKLATAIAVRDDHSGDDIAALVPKQSARICRSADVVFGLSETFRGESPPAERRIIAVAVQQNPLVPPVSFEALSSLVRRLAKSADRDQEIVLLAHDVRDDFDLGLARDLVAEIGLPRISVRSFTTTDECIAYYRQIRSIISFRMHPIIFGACAGAYCVPLEGSRKIADLATRLGLPLPSIGGLLAADDDDFRNMTGIGAQAPQADPGARAQLSRLGGSVVSSLVGGRG